MCMEHNYKKMYIPATTAQMSTDRLSLIMYCKLQLNTIATMSSATTIKYICTSFMIEHLPCLMYIVHNIYSFFFDDVKNKRPSFNLTGKSFYVSFSRSELYYGIMHFETL